MCLAFITPYFGAAPPEGLLHRTFVRLAPLRDDEIHQPGCLDSALGASGGAPARPGAPGTHGSQLSPPLVDAAQAARSARARMGDAHGRAAAR